MSATKPSSPRSLVLPMKGILRTVGIGLAVAFPVLALAAALFAGWPGFWGVVLGLGIPVVFLGATVVVALLTARATPTVFGAVVLGSWLAKIIVMAGVLALIDTADFWSRPWFFVAFVIGIVGWLSAEAATVLRSQTPYVDT